MCFILHKAKTNFQIVIFFFDSVKLPRRYFTLLQADLVATSKGPDSRASQAARFEDTQRSSSSLNAQEVLLYGLRVTFLYICPPRRSANFSPELSAIPTWGKEAGSGRKTRLLAGTAETTL